jgi:hypothetical protein
MRVLSRGLALALLLFTAACGSRGSEIDPKTSFTPGQDQSGLVVVGIAAQRYASFLGITHMGSVSSINLTWTRIENGMAPERRADRVLMEYRRRACSGDSVLPGIGGNTTTSGDPCDMREMARHVLRVPPGDYQLTEIGTLNSNGTQQTYTTTRLADSAARIAHVGPGEIVYLGDLTYELIGGPARPVRLQRNDAAAQRALSALPLVGPGEMVFRPMVPRESVVKSAAPPG